MFLLQAVLVLLLAVGVKSQAWDVVLLVRVLLMVAMVVVVGKVVVEGLVGIQAESIRDFRGLLLAQGGPCLILLVVLHALLGLQGQVLLERER